MGLLGDLFGNTLVGGEFFGGSDAGAQAAQAEAAGNRNAIAELRRQFDITQGNIQPFLEAGQQAVPGLNQASTAGGLDQRLREIFNTDIFGSLVDERTRAVENRNAASGNLRSGAGLLDAARVPTELGLGLEQLLFGRQSNLAGSGQNAALGLGSLGATSSGSIANLLQDTGRAIGGGFITDAQADAAQQAQLLNAGASIGSAALFFSDPNLKENVEEIGTIRDLTLFQWDWIEAAKNTIVGACHTMGFMSDEVKEKYPHHVYEFCGFDVIDYHPLLAELEAA